MQKQTFSVSWLAVNLGMDRRTLSRRLEAVKPAKSERTGRGSERQYFLRDVVDAVFTRERPEGELDLTQERARLARAQSERVETENRVRSRELVSFEFVRSWYGKHIIGCRARLIQVPYAIAAQFTPDIAPSIEAAARSRIYEALQELADGAASPPDDAFDDEPEDTDPDEGAAAV